MKRPILLNGFMGTGKTTVGKELAGLCGTPFVDLDAEIERRTGNSIPEIFTQRGENAFREMECAALEAELNNPQPRVLAVGGGALLERATRLRVMDQCVLVTLDASPQVVAERVDNQGASRPLLRDGALAHAIRLLELRKPAYAEAHEVVDVSSRRPNEIARELREIWHRDPVGVAAGADSYSVEVGRGIFQQRLTAEIGEAPVALIVTDTNVHKHYGTTAHMAAKAAGARTSVFAMPAGEEHKALPTLSKIWDHALEVGADRKSCFVGLGGGVATDVAGFAAASWMRGVRWVSVPTSLLGMVDASVGGKTAVDLPGAKNCVGAFWQPSRVICDVDHLSTEPAAGRAALSEVVKTALLGDADLFQLLEDEADAIRAGDSDLMAELVHRCVRVKARVVSQDAREGGIRAALNLGHTVGHALEALDGYGELSHGNAVSLGLVAAMRLGDRFSFNKPGTTERTLRLLERLGLPATLRDQPLTRAAGLLGRDKKRGGNAIRFVFSPEPGQIRFHNFELQELEAAVTALTE